jgi:hypothetical protein
MKTTLVRKFQMPAAKESAPALQTAQPESAQQPPPHATADCDIPEINTDFIDNLWQDPTFVNRFDASFDKTALMGLDGEIVKLPAAAQENAGLLDLDFPGIPSE